MRRLLRLTPLAVVLVVLGLAVGLPQAGAIVGGTADATHTSVGILYIDDQPWYLGFCSGSLIASDEFLTAGHCTAALSPARVAHFYVTFDDTISVDPLTGVISSEHPIAVSGFTTDPDFSVGQNDVGVVHLAEDVSRPPVELPGVGFLDKEAEAGDLRDHTFLGVGYGINGAKGTWKSPQADVTWDKQRESGPVLFQALAHGYVHTVSGADAGDSGGPLFYASDSNLAVGITSYGAESSVGPSNYQRLDTQSVHDWLQEILASH